MKKFKVAVIGSGIAGMEAAAQLLAMDCDVCIIEKSYSSGGNVALWNHLFPDFKSSNTFLTEIKNNISNSAQIIFGVEVHRCQKYENQYRLYLSDGEVLDVNAVVIATGFQPFDALRKEEYGYTIYPKVITSVDLEQKLKEDSSFFSNKELSRIAFIHCVGSRDEKVKNRYCSKVCCITAVKQAIEIAKRLPDVEIFAFYMDLRLYDRYFEDLFYDAQSKYKIKFIRGRLSEIAEDPDHRLVLKAEDTLLSKPMRLTVDIVVLMVGMTARNENTMISKIFNIKQGNDGFFEAADLHYSQNISTQPGIFLTGTCTGPKSISETIQDARAVAFEVFRYVQPFQ